MAPTYHAYYDVWRLQDDLLILAWHRTLVTNAPHRVYREGMDKLRAESKAASEKHPKDYALFRKMVTEALRLPEDMEPGMGTLYLPDEGSPEKTVVLPVAIYRVRPLEEWLSIWLDKFVDVLGSMPDNKKYARANSIAETMMTVVGLRLKITPEDTQPEIANGGKGYVELGQCRLLTECFKDMDEALVKLLVELDDVEWDQYSIFSGTDKGTSASGDAAERPLLPVSRCEIRFDEEQQTGRKIPVLHIDKGRAGVLIEQKRSKPNQLLTALEMARKNSGKIECLHKQTAYLINEAFGLCADRAGFDGYSEEVLVCDGGTKYHFNIAFESQAVKKPERADLFHSRYVETNIEKPDERPGPKQMSPLDVAIYKEDLERELGAEKAQEVLRDMGLID